MIWNTVNSVFPTLLCWYKRFSTPAPHPPPIVLQLPYNYNLTFQRSSFNGVSGRNSNSMKIRIYNFFYELFYHFSVKFAQHKAK